MEASPCKSTPCVYVCAGLNTFVVYIACSLCCAMYTISVFFLHRLMGSQCIRPSLAMGIHWGALASLGHTIRVCEGGEGEGDKVVGIVL